MVARPLSLCPQSTMIGTMQRLILPACLMLAACGQGDTDPGPGGVTVAEARALDEAAEMIEQRRLAGEPGEGSGEGSAPQSTPAPADDVTQ